MPDRDAEVIWLLRRLASGATLRRASDGHFELVSPGQDGRTSVRTVACSLVERCTANDWVRTADGNLTPTDAGIAHLRRALSSTDAFRQQHQMQVAAPRDVEGVRKPVLTNAGESPLGWLRTRKDRNGIPLLSEAQFEAGERLRRDYELAHLATRVTSDWSGLAPSARARRGPQALNIPDSVIAAKERVMRALAQVGPELAGVLIDVCCELKGLEEAEKIRGWPQRAGKVVLQIALTRLARHYGLLAGEEAPRPRRLRHWGSDDYNPTLDAWAARD